MGLFAGNIQIKIGQASSDIHETLERLCDAYLASKDDFKRTDDLPASDYFFSIFPLRSSGWLSITNSDTMGCDLPGSLEFAAFISSSLKCPALVNFVFDSDDAITVIIRCGKIIKAFSNKKSNIKGIKVSTEEAKHKYQELEAIWKKRETFKEKLIERTAAYFQDDSRYWLMNGHYREGSRTIGYRLRNYITKFAESTSEPMIVWSGSQIPQLVENKEIPIRETFSNIGRRFTGVAIRIRVDGGAANIRDVSDPAIQRSAGGEKHTPSGIIRDDKYIECQFNETAIAGGIYEFAAKHATFKYPSVFAQDYQQWGTVYDKNKNPVGRTQVVGKNYTFSAKLVLARPLKTISIQIYPLQLGPSKALEYVIGKPAPFPHRTTEEIMREIENGKTVNENQ